jgi:type IV pilus assembly protein PilC
MKRKPAVNRRASFLSTFGLGRDRDYFIENSSLLIASGMGVIEALNAVSTDVKSGRMRKLITGMKDDIEAGFPIWRALDRARLFPSHAISLIRIGEESGKLSENLQVVSVEQEKDREFRSKIRAAMMYPVFVLGLTLVFGIGISFFILPKLALVFSQLHIQLPLITRILISVGLYLGDKGTSMIPVVLFAGALLIYLVFFFPKTKLLGQSILFAIPGVKRLIQEVEVARFGYLLGTLLEAGLPITLALQSLTQVSSFPHYVKLYEHLERKIEEGNSFQTSFASYHRLNRLIPTPVQQLIITGERSGNLPEILKKVGVTYEAKTDATTKNLTVILEPVLLVIVWLGVIGVALAVILPIYRLVGQLQTQ